MSYDAAQFRFKLSRSMKERIVLVATVLGASVAVAVTAILWGARPEPTGQAATAVEALFIGELDHGLPVYRLPSISVSPRRDVELVRRSAPTRDVPRPGRPAQGAPAAG